MSKKVVREVKLTYIEQVLLKKMMPPQVAKELNVNEETVYDWIKK